MSDETPFETIAERSITLAKALLSKASKEYHDDVKTHPSEGELAQALMVVMPYFGCLYVPEAPDGELGGVMLTAEPVDRLGLILRPVGQMDDGMGLAASVYKPNGMEWDTAMSILSTVITNMKEHKHCSHPHDTKH